MLFNIYFTLKCKHTIIFNLANRIIVVSRAIQDNNVELTCRNIFAGIDCQGPVDTAKSSPLGNGWTGNMSPGNSMKMKLIALRR